MSSNKYINLLIQEAQKRRNSNSSNKNNTGGETFTLSHDRTRLVPSYASIIDTTNQSMNRLSAGRIKHLIPQPRQQQALVVSTSSPKNTPVEAFSITSEQNQEYEKEWPRAISQTYGEHHQANAIHPNSCHSSCSHPDRYHNKTTTSPSQTSCSKPIHNFSSRKGNPTSGGVPSPSVVEVQKDHDQLESTFLWKVIFLSSYICLILYTIIILIGPILLENFVDRSIWCPDYYPHSQKLTEGQQPLEVQENTFLSRFLKSSSDHIHHHDGSYMDDDPRKGILQQQQHYGSVYENPDYDTDPCRYERLPLLMFLTLEEADLSMRLLASVIMGSIIGYERRSTDRPAGIRTMGLVSLGSCFFTIASEIAFKSSTMSWDASRVTAAIPSGVGFLGAGLIWKGTLSTGKNGEVHQVHGLTTAASVWLSAAVGCGAGGKLYFVSTYAMILVVIILRYGPKFYYEPNENSMSGVGARDNSSNIDDQDSVSETYHRRSDSVESWDQLKGGRTVSNYNRGIRYVLYPKACVDRSKIDEQGDFLFQTSSTRVPKYVSEYSSD